MRQHPFSAGTARGILAALHWSLNGLLASFALVGALMADGVCHSALKAQGSGTPVKRSLRLTVRPHTMVLGTRTTKAGAYALDTLGDSVYIPAKAVGAQRVPLVLAFGNSIELWRPLSDHYGMVFVTLAGSWKYIIEQEGLQDIDAILQTVLSSYAVDPDKIALAGVSNGANLVALIGCQNLDIFSRLGLMSTIPGALPACADTTQPLAARTQMFVTVGTGEPNIVLTEGLEMAPLARRSGHPVQHVLNLRFHEGRQQDFGNLFQWLVDSWASPTITPRAVPPLRAGAVLPLTTDVLAKMTTFWRSFNFEQAEGWPAMYKKAIEIPVGVELMTSYDMKDLQAIAAEEPSIADNLKKTGLTFSEEEGYRAAVIGARVTMLTQDKRPSLTSVPEVAQNVKFVREHLQEVNTLLDAMQVPRCEAGIQEQFLPGSCVTN